MSRGKGALCRKASSTTLLYSANSTKAMSTKSRPTGVTILAILEIIGGIFALLASATFFLLGALATGIEFDMVEGAPFMMPF